MNTYQIVHPFSSGSSYKNLLEISPADTLFLELKNLDSSFNSAIATFSVKKGKLTDDLSLLDNVLPPFENTGNLTQTFSAEIINQTQIIVLKPSQTGALDLNTLYSLEIEIVKTDTTRESWQFELKTGQDIVNGVVPNNPAIPVVKFLGSQTEAPATAQISNIYYNSNTGHFYQYTGTAWIDISQDNNNLVLDTLRLNTGYTPTGIEEVGTTFWDADNHSLTTIYENGAKLQHGFELYTFGTDENNDFPEGSAVSVKGSNGNKVAFELTDLTDRESVDNYIGLLTTPIDSGNRIATRDGRVKNIKTNYTGTGYWGTTWVEGQWVYVSSTAGKLTNVKPTEPTPVIRVGTITNISANEGIIELDRLIETDLTNRVKTDIVREPTGFQDPLNITINYNSTNRTITLTGTIEGYYRNNRITELTSGWISPAHPSTLDKNYFLVYNGTAFQWLDLSIEPLDLSYLLICYVNYGTTHKYAIREAHGLMQWQAHKEFHETIGTYKKSGGDLSDFVLNSTTAGDRRPLISSCLVYDEDLPTQIPALSTEVYTHYFLSGAGGTSNFVLDQTDIVPLSTNRPYFNEWTGSVWQQTLVTVNNYMSVWVVAVPTTADTTSQKYRFLFIQGQTQGTLATEQAKIPNDLNLGQLSTLATEFVFIAKIIIRHTGGNWQVVQVDKLTGSRVNTTSSPTGSFLSSVSTNTTLSGDGTTINPLSFNKFEIGNGSPLTSPDDGSVYLDNLNKILYIRSGGVWCFLTLNIPT